MEFELDPAKSAINKEKHGIDFDEAQVLWLDDFRIDTDAGYGPEVRRVTVGRIGVKLWTGVYTLRGRMIRIISVRRARTNERMLY
jgi:uncharacterized DUF497 family protein